MAQWFAIGKEIKDSINNKIGGITSGIMQAGSIYGGNPAGLGSIGFQQQQNQAPMLQPSQTQSSVPSQYSFMPDSSNYIPNTDFAQRVTGKQPSKLFQFLSNGG
jgi:hypothetical protein